MGFDNIARQSGKRYSLIDGESAKRKVSASTVKAFKRFLVGKSSPLKATARGLLQIYFLSARKPFNMGKKKQVEQLGVSHWVVDRIRRIAQTGPFRETKKEYEQVETDGHPVRDQFLAWDKVDLEARVILFIVDMVLKSEDGWAHPSEAEIAERLNTTSAWISEKVDKLERLGLLEVKRTPGKRNAYRPNFALVAKEVKISAAKPEFGSIIRDLSLSPTLTEALNETVRAALQLELNDDPIKVERAIVELYQRIISERDKPRSAGTNFRSANLTLVREYVEWLGERDWGHATIKVLDLDSPAFSAFRKWTTENDEHDPITGRHRYA